MIREYLCTFSPLGCSSLFSICLSSDERERERETASLTRLPSKARLHLHLRSPSQTLFFFSFFLSSSSSNSLLSPFDRSPSSTSLSLSLSLISLTNLFPVSVFLAYCFLSPSPSPSPSIPLSRRPSSKNMSNTNLEFQFPPIENSEFPSQSDDSVGSLAKEKAPLSKESDVNSRPEDRTAKLCNEIWMDRSAATENKEELSGESVRSELGGRLDVRKEEAAPGDEELQGARSKLLECRTPTSKEHLIPQPGNTPPPAPRKRRRETTSPPCKRKLLPDFDFYEAANREEVDDFFRSGFELTAKLAKRKKINI